MSEAAATAAALPSGNRAPTEADFNSAVGLLMDQLSDTVELGIALGKDQTEIMARIMGAVAQLGSK